MDNGNVQLRFFQYIKTKVPANVSFVDEIADLLNISNDSAYRRIRADKPISFEELQKLCVQYKVSLDQFLNLQSDAFIFTGKLDNNENFRFENWLEEVLKQYSIVSSFEKKHIYFLLKDLPFNMHFQIPELMAFKCFVWKRSFTGYQAEKGDTFTFDYPGFEEHNAIGQKIVQVYNTIPTTEIWNTEAINSTLQQIEYYYDAGNSISRDQAVILLNKVEELVSHVEKQAEAGCKFRIGEKPQPGSASYQLFNNELVLGDNTILAEMGEMKATFLNHSFMHFIATRDDSFNTAMLNKLNNLIQRSTLISTSNERERIGFFNLLRNEIKQRKEKMLL
ncbi:MAG: hypothetical protein IPI54_11010 [Chitinophagaceae bacterium]|nr:hypothetical protein [Chitinophagaceae bacterium]